MSTITELPASARQRGYIDSLAKAIHYRLPEESRDLYDRHAARLLTAPEASELIRILKEQDDVRRGAKRATTEPAFVRVGNEWLLAGPHLRAGQVVEVQSASGRVRRVRVVALRGRTPEGVAYAIHAFVDGRR